MTRSIDPGRKSFHVGELRMDVVDDHSVPPGKLRLSQVVDGTNAVVSQLVHVSGKCVELLGDVVRSAIAAGILVDKFLEEDLGEEERARLERLRKLLRGQGKDDDFPEWLR